MKNSKQDGFISVSEIPAVDLHKQDESHLIVAKLASLISKYIFNTVRGESKTPVNTVLQSGHVEAQSGFWLRFN